MGPERATVGVSTMAEMNALEVKGIVIEALPNALYRVELESKKCVVAHVSHEPRRNFVKILTGDRVVVTVSPRNRTRGRITERRG